MLTSESQSADDAEVRVGEGAPAARRDALEERAEDLLGVGRADGLEARVGHRLERVGERAGVADHPLTARPRSDERLGVRVGVRAPGRGADVEDEER